jgi:PAS domain S-box-containing protein
MHKINILLVDDREENLIALAALIKRDDINIISTTSPNEALKLAWENDISIALIDVQMPEIDGFELTEMLKSNPRTKDILIIFVTAISKDVKYVVKGLNAGAIDYLYKPLNPYVTAAKVDSFIQLAKAQYEIKKKNEELANYAIVVNNSPDIICSVNAKDNEILTISPAIEALTGYKIDDVLGQNITQFIDEEDQESFQKQLYNLVYGMLNIVVAEARFKKSNNDILWVEYRVSHKNDTYFFNISDVTNQKEYENQLIEAKTAAENAKKVKEIFLANMSHELRTPINGIIGLSNLLNNTPLDEDQKEMVKLLEVSSQSLLGVVNDVLDLSKIESGKFSILRKEINLKDLLQSVTNLLRFKADEKLIKLDLVIDQSVPTYVIADGLRLNQILMNLLSNAIKFTEKGSVTLSVNAKKSAEDAVILAISVADTGIGIPDNRIDNIFEPYVQAEDDTASKYGGTGLGLAIVKQLTELKGGKLSVSSKIGEGSVFTFENKFALDSVMPNFSIELNSELTSFKGKRVLLAEDNMVNQFMIKKILKGWEIDVSAVDNGLKVLEYLRLESFDLILMDTHMPDMGGFETTQKIRNEFDGEKKAIKIISLSAAVLEEEKQAALAAGMDDVLTKPFKLIDLHRLMSKMLA